MIYDIYTDGSTKRNGADSNVGGYAFVVVDSYRGTLLDAYAQTGIENTTNNRMELMAILSALFMYQKRMRSSKDEGAIIRLFSDSIYALNSLFVWSMDWAVHSWKTKTGTEVKNKDLIKPFYEKYWGRYLKNQMAGRTDSWRNFQWHHIEGHHGYKWNEIADKLATGELTVEEVFENENRN